MIVVFLFAAFVGFIAAQPNVGFFQNPTAGNDNHDYGSNPVYEIGETLTIKWTTVFDNYSIALWQQSASELSAKSGPAILTTLPGATSITEFPWDVSVYSFDLKFSPIFFLWLRPGDPAPDKNGTISRYFNITLPSVSANASSTSLSTPTSTTSSTPSQTAIALPTTNATSPNTSSNSFSKGDKIGVGLGVVGFAIIVAGIIVVIYYRRKKTRSRLENQRPEEITQEYVKPELPQSSARHELAS